MSEVGIGLSGNLVEPRKSTQVPKRAIFLPNKEDQSSMGK